MIVLDTHAWLWWVSDRKRLSGRARAAIETAAAIGVSAISSWEVAMLVRRGRIAVDRDLDDWVRQSLGLERVVSLPIDSEIAVAAAQLDESRFPGDPADRIIVATARLLRAPLVTRDAAIRGFDRRLTIW